jgi:hypothetical protein
MKSIKNLTRFTYETSAFQGWRLSVSSKGANFTKYFSDKQHGGEEKAFAVAQAALESLRELLGKAKLADGKHTEKTVEKGTKLLAKAG